VLAQHAPANAIDDRSEIEHDRHAVCARQRRDDRGWAIAIVRCGITGATRLTVVDRESRTPGVSKVRGCWPMRRSGAGRQAGEERVLRHPTAVADGAIGRVAMNVTFPPV
jgi:hypothetical protein